MDGQNKAYQVEQSLLATRRVFNELVNDNSLKTKLEKAKGSADVQRIYSNFSRMYFAGCKHRKVLPRIIHHSKLSAHVRSLGKAEFKGDTFARENALKTLQDLRSSRWCQGV